MPIGRKPPAYLQLVETQTKADPMPNDVFIHRGWQRSLFAAPNDSLLCFIDLSALSQSDFVRVILEAKPRHVFDLRLVPTFDLGSLSRKLVFELFSQVGAKYFDVPGLFEIRELNDARFNPGILVPAIFDLMAVPVIDGPVVIIVDKNLSNEEFIVSFVSKAQHVRALGWELLVLPAQESTGVASAARKMIFISHANPEENDFAKWLVTQLSLLGYDVWSDLTKIVGGNYFWTSIEDAIRNYAAKVVVVLSKPAQMKSGVLDEINCALSVERKERIAQFVVPIKIDDLAFDDVMANLARKSILDFSKGWMPGLEALKKVFEEDRVPKVANAEKSIVSMWSSIHSSREVIPKDDFLISNWLRVEELPESMLISRSDQPSTNALDQLLLLENKVDERAVLEIGKAIRGELDSVEYRAVANATSSFLRRSWDEHAARNGLRAYELSGGRLAWYVPAGLISKDTATFKAIDGKQRRKILVGRSEKRGVYWHYGVELRPFVGRVSRFSFISHVIFSKDGGCDVLPSERMHVLRRGFCKSWWNDRWRDLELAFLSWLAPRGKLKLELDSFSCVLNCRPVPFVAPMSLAPSAADVYDGMISEIEWEDLDTEDVDLPAADGEDFDDEV